MFTKALILAAGLGTRLRPLTEHIPKAMVPILGRPILEYNLDLCHQHGIKEVVVNLHYFADEIRNYFGDTYKDVSLTYYYEDSLLENAGTVRELQSYFANEPSFLVLASDNLVDLNLTEFSEFHDEHNGVVSIATACADDVSKYGIVQTDSSGKIITFQEKPQPEEALGDQVATCIYAFSSDIFKEIPGGVVHFGRDIFPSLLESHQYDLYAFKHDGYWNDIGNATTFLQANMDVLQGNLAFPFGDLPENRNSYIAPTATVKNSSVVGSVILGNVSIQDSTISNSIISQNNEIAYSSLSKVLTGEKCVVKEASLSDVHIWPEAIIKKHAKS